MHTNKKGDVMYNLFVESFAYTSNNDKLIVVKDAANDVRHVFSKDELIEKIKENNDFKGIVGVRYPVSSEKALGFDYSSLNPYDVQIRCENFNPYFAFKELKLYSFEIFDAFMGYGFSNTSKVVALFVKKVDDNHGLFIIEEGEQELRLDIIINIEKIDETLDENAKLFESFVFCYNSYIDKINYEDTRKSRYSTLAEYLDEYKETHKKEYEKILDTL
jgi:hypothetical protein